MLNNLTRSVNGDTCLFMDFNLDVEIAKELEMHDYGREGEKGSR